MTDNSQNNAGGQSGMDKETEGRNLENESGQGGGFGSETSQQGGQQSGQQQSGQQWQDGETSQSGGEAGGQSEREFGQQSIR